MFGVDQPLSDLTKIGIQNRLMLLGAGYDQNGHLAINAQAGGSQTFEDIFVKGHAVTNYFFFVDRLDKKTSRSVRKKS